VFRFLNVTRVCSARADWRPPDATKLWIYNLHYFDDLNAHGAPTRLDWHRDLLERWIAENPPGCGDGWEPYPLSMRIVNWIKWHLTHGALDQDGVASLADQVRFLARRLEYHLRGNHLFENFKALAVAGCFFDGAEAERWLRKGLGGLERSVREQILPDGGHVERSPMYQGLLAGGLLDLVNILRCYRFPVPSWLVDACRRMNFWNAALAQPDGEWAQFNDTSQGYAARPAELVDYQARLGLGPTATPSDFTHLTESGYVRAARGDLTLFADVGDLGPDYNPGHGHADTLTYELAFRGHRFIVDTGISTYEAGATRSSERSTAAHNSVEVDGVDSSEVWASFRVARRAKASWIGHTKEESALTFSAGHDGYRRLAGRPIHRRDWRLASDMLQVTDTIQSSATHQLRAGVHLHADCQAEPDGTASVLVRHKGGAFIARVDRGSWTELNIENYWYAPEFGRAEQAKCLVLKHRSDGKTRLCYSIHTK
jgi:uncharacterized heparinase superfamily protein